MKISLIAITILLATGMFVVNESCIIPEQEETKQANKVEEINTTIETEGMFKGLKKTDMGTYIPESYEQVYECMKQSEYFNEMENVYGYKILYSWEEYQEIFEEKNKIVRQGYPKNSILSPYLIDIEYIDYINYMIFVPSTQLDKTENQRLGLSENNYKIIYEDIMKLQSDTDETEYANPDEMEVMYVSCKYDEIPSSICTLTSKFPRLYPVTYAPIDVIEVGASKIDIYHNFGNSVYVYVLTQEEELINVQGNYFEEIGDDNMPEPVQVSEVEKIICMYMHPDYDRSAYCMVAKFVVFDIEE